MEIEEKTNASESSEDTKGSDNVTMPRRIEAMKVDEDSRNINCGSSPSQKGDSKPPENVMKEDSSVLICNDDKDMNESNEEGCSDSSDCEGKTGGIVADKSKHTEDVCCSFGTGDETDIHSAVNDDIKERDGDNSVDNSSETVTKALDSTKTTLTGHTAMLKNENESCDLPETNLLVEESISSLPENSDNISDVTNDEDADTLEEKTLNSLDAESENIDIPLKRHADESESLDGLAKKLLKSQDANQKKEPEGCLDPSPAHLLNKDKPNSDSDMEIDSNDIDSDPEFLSSKLPDESNPDGSALSFTKYPNQAETEATKLECEAQINEDLISGMILAPEDVIIECKDKKNFFYCNVCHCTVHSSIKNVRVHRKGKSHKAAMIKYKKSVVTTVKNITSLDKSGPHYMLLDCYVERYKPRGYYCRVCNFIGEKLKAMDDHVHGKWHETNICIMKGREIIAQQKDNADKGTQDEMKELDEEYYKILEVERLKSWNSYSTAIAEDVLKNKASLNLESYCNIQNPSLYSDSQDSFPQNQYYQNFMHTMNQDAFRQSPALADPSVKSDTLTVSETGTNQQTTSCFPYSQQNPVPDASKFQQTKVPALSQSQKANSGFDVPFVVTKESDAEIVVEVVNSLLQTYLKYKLRGLPKSHFKLPPKPKTEEHVSHINRFSTNRTAEQNFHNLQNSKSKYQSAFTPNDARHSPDLYRNISNKYIENRSWKRMHANETAYSEKLHDLPMDSKNPRSYKSFLTEDKTDDSYHHLCSENQMRKPIVPRSIDIIKQNQDSFLRNVKGTDSIVDELLCYRSSYKDDDSPKRIRLNKPFINDTYRKYKNYEDISSDLTGQNRSSDYSFMKQYRSSINDNITKQNESSINELFKQYQNFEKDSSTRSTRQFEPYTTDFSGVYSRGCDIEDSYSRKRNQNAQSISHLMKKFRNSSSFSHH